MPAALTFMSKAHRLETGIRSIPITVTGLLTVGGVTTWLNTTDALSAQSGIAYVGPERGRFNDWRLIGVFLVTGQNVTLSARRLINGLWAAEVAADTPWALVAGDIALVQSATPQTKINWLLTSEQNLYTTNGGVGPSVLTFDGFLTNDPNPGV